MSRRKITAGITSVSVPIRVDDTSSTTGGGLGSLAYNTAGLVAEYRRQGQSSWTSITLAAGTLGTWSSGGFVADGSLAGSYEFGIPDAAFLSGRWVTVRLYGATSMAPVLLEFELDAINYQDAVRGGMTALPNTACTTSASLVTSGTGTDQISVSAGKTLLQATQAGVTIPTVTTVGTLTTYTGNTPQTGDSFARIGAAGAGLTGITGAALAATQSFNNTGQTANVPANTKQFLGQAVVLDAGNLPSVNLADYAGSAVSLSDGAAQGGSTTSITLASSASAVTDAYKGYRVTGVSGSGAAQYAYISAYNGTSKAASLDRTLATAFDGTTTYALDAPQAADVVQWLGATPAALSGGLVQATATLALGTDAISAASLSTAAISKIQAGLATPTNITAGTITTAINLTNAPTAGDFTTTMKTSLNAATPAAADSAGTTSLLARLSSTRAGYLDNLSVGPVAQASTALLASIWTNTKAGFLDAAVSGISSGGTAPTVTQIRQEMDANSLKLANLDVTVGSRATAATAAAAILATPAQKILTDANGYVTTSNPASTGSAVTEATIWAYATRTLSDRTGFSLTTAYDPAKTAAQAMTALSKATWTDARAGYLDGLSGGGGSVTVAGYASGQDPATLTWAASTRSLTDKAGFALSAAGLDQLSVADPGSPSGHTTLPRMLVALYRRFYRKVAKTPTQITLYKDDGTTANATQPVADDGAGTESVGAAG